MDCENQEKDKDGNSTTTGAFNNSNTNNSECGHGEQNKQHVLFPWIHTSALMLCVVSQVFRL